ncbi:hypothetical protein [Actinophytocola gossypii]|uniref:Uncharacterized protein n=1 Tax=Actinophytocola gossypii TaxID=2812003 RepID=A0ABT2J812_9PSEU|nr:hypothetical protein [Actinophytocola gossypii]MCT2584009.1 hypothetical protein [Actinophytocola gossypii]
MRALLIAAAAAGLVGLAGCGQGTGDGGDDVSAGTDRSSVVAEPTPPEVTRTPPETKPQDPPGDTEAKGTPAARVTLSPSGPVVPPDVRQVPAEQVDASAVPEYNEHRGLVWVYDDGYSLQTFAMATSGCTGVEGEVVTETASEVVIATRPLPQPQGGPADGRMCTTVMTPRPVTVTLDAPLGDRTVRLESGR